jgi:hypothetical protein
MAAQMRFLDQAVETERTAWLPRPVAGVTPATARVELEASDEVEALFERAEAAQAAAKKADHDAWMTAALGAGWTVEQAQALEVDWMVESQERRPELWDEFAGVPGTEERLHFHSGSNHLGEIRGMVKVGEHVGVAVNRLSREAEGELVEMGLRAKREECPVLRRLLGRVRVFADSGAFEELSTGLAITDPEWKARLATYRRLGEALGARLSVVAPDRVGDQVGTLVRLRQYAGYLADIAATGAEVFVTVASGEKDRVSFWREAAMAAGVDGTWVPAFPMRAKPATAAELEAFCEAVRPARLHLLGIGPQSKGWAEVLAAVRRGCPECEVSSDSVWLSAVVGRDQPGGRVGTRERDALLAAGADETDVEGLKKAWVTRAMLKYRHGKLLDLARGGWRWDAEYGFEQGALL